MRGPAFFLFIALLLPQAGFAEDYIIGEGDILRVSVWGEEQLSLPVRVRPDGKITVPALGDVRAAGLTTKALQRLLTEKLTRLIKKPVVTVIVEEITNNKVYVFGGGVKSGVYNLTRRTTLLQLLCQIGELDNADLKNAYVLRNGMKVKADFHRLFIEGDMTEEVAVKPNDVVFIPAVVDKNVYVVGAVQRPRFIVYREGLTVMAAILEAGGFTKFAKLNSIVVFRENGGEEFAIAVKAKKLMQDGELEQNVKLRPGDYVVVKEGMF